MKENDMKSCFQKRDDIGGKDCQLYKNYIFLESYYTAPNGMLERIDENEDFVYTKDMENQRHFEVREAMQKGIVEF